MGGAYVGGQRVRRHSARELDRVVASSSGHLFCARHTPTMRLAAQAAGRGRAARYNSIDTYRFVEPKTATIKNTAASSDTTLIIVIVTVVLVVVGAALLLLRRARGHSETE